MNRTILIAFSLVLLCVSPLHAVTHEWTRQLGTAEYEVANSVSPDGLGNVYITGTTDGLLGDTHAGDWDAFLSKYDDSGNLLWTEQLGTPFDDRSWGVSADGQGSVYIAGFTQGTLGSANAGGWDAFLSKYDSAGNLLWTEQFGTAEGNIGHNVTTDGLGNVYVSGWTEGNLGGANAGLWDTFVSKFDDAGNLLWTKQLGSAGYDESWGVSADGLGNIYISGYTNGDLGGASAGGFDAIVSKYDTEGNHLWTEQLGSVNDDGSYGVSADVLGNVFISGLTEGDLGGTNAGGRDAFVSKYDTEGNLLWTQQLGTTTVDESHSVCADGLGNVYISGFTWGPLGGTQVIPDASADAGDAFFLGKLDGAGNLLWIEQAIQGRTGEVSIDGLGNVYITGDTLSGFDVQNSGHLDAFLMKFSDPIPEPSTAVLGLLSCAALLPRRKR